MAEIRPRISKDNLDYFTSVEGVKVPFDVGLSLFRIKVKDMLKND